MNTEFMKKYRKLGKYHGAWMVLQYLEEGEEKALGREDLCGLTGLRDRELRVVISKIRREVPVLSFGNGYFIPKDTEKHLINRWLEQEQSRAKSIFWSMRGARKAVKE